MPFRIDYSGSALYFLTEVSSEDASEQVVESRLSFCG